MNGVLTVQQKQQVVVRYAAGTSLTALAADYGVSRQAIHGILVRRGVVLRPWGKLTDQQKLDVVARYEGGETPTALAARFGVAPPSITGILKRRGVCMRPPKQYTVWDGAFDDLTPEAAYWAGFLFADGTIHCRPGYPPNIAVGLSAVGIGHLVNLRSFLRVPIMRSRLSLRSLGGVTGRSRHASSVFDPSGSRTGYSA